jgi:hypothetical protein
LIRPGTLVFCDINLKPLTFPAAQSQSRDAETLKGVVAASNACKRQSQPLDGLAQDAAQLSILSGIKEFLMVSQPLGKLDVTIDSRLVFEKRVQYDDRDLTPTLAARQHLKSRFPWNLRVRSDKTGLIHCHRVGEQDRAFLDRLFHLVLWPECDGKYTLSGRAIAVGKELDSERPRTRTLIKLIERHLQRDVPKDAEVSAWEIEEIIQKAPKNSSEPAHLISSLRDMLAETGYKQLIVTADQAYSLSEKASVAWVTKQ